jgi:hypothetical protein
MDRNTTQNNFLDGVWVHFDGWWCFTLVAWARNPPTMPYIWGGKSCPLKRRTGGLPFEVKDLSEACSHTKITKNKSKSMLYFSWLGILEGSPFKVPFVCKDQVCRVQILVYIFGAQPKCFCSPKFIPHTHLPGHIP